MNWNVHNLQEPSLVSVILFGSQARGDHDSLSDIDLCLFVEDISYEDLVQLKERMARYLTVPPLSLSVYTKPVVERMRERGSLFLWHLKLEGCILLDRSSYASSILEDVVPFTLYGDEIATYRDLWEDVWRTVAECGALSEFDYHILHGIVRDCCILLGYFWGRPVFGRISAFRNARALMTFFPLDEDSFNILAYWHLVYLRNLPVTRDLPDASAAESLIAAVGDVIELCQTTLT